jgi:hypothetical protein
MKGGGMMKMMKRLGGMKGMPKMPFGHGVQEAFVFRDFQFHCALSIWNWACSAPL